MIVRKVQAANFMRFRTLNISGLPERGLIGILGANESGKSTVGDIISYGLFGKSTRAPRGERERVITWGQNTAEIKLHFEVADRQYEVYRRIRLDGPSDAYLMDLDRGREIAVGASQVEQKIRDLLGFGFREFRFSTYIAQKELSLILDVSADRRDVLDKMLGIRKLRDVSRTVAKKAVALRRDIELEETLLMEKTRALDALNERKIERARIKGKTAELESRLNRAQQERDRIHGELGALKETRSVVYRIEAQENRLNIERERLREIDRQVAELQRKQSEVFDIEEELGKTRHRIAALDESIAEVAKGLDIQRTYRDLGEKIAARKKSMAGKRADLEAVKAELARVEATEKQIQESEQELHELIAYLESHSERDVKELSRSLRTAVDRAETARLRALGELRRRAEKWTAEENETADKIARLKDRIESAAPEEPDRDEIIALEEREYSLRTRRNSALLGSVVPLGAAGFCAVFFNPLFGFIGLGSVALWGLALRSGRDIAETHDKLILAQQRQYALNITRRNLQQMQEDLDLLEELYDQRSRGAAAAAALFERLEAHPRGNFGQMRELLELIAAEDEPFLDEWREALEQSAHCFREMNLRDADRLLVEAVIEQAVRLIELKAARKQELQQQLAALRGQVMDKAVLLRKYDSLVTEIEAGARLIGDLESELPRDRDADEEYQSLARKHDELLDEFKRLKDGAQAMTSRAEDYRAEVLELPNITSRKKTIMSTIDRGLEELYKLKSQVKDQDSSDDRFNYFMDKERKIEDEILRLTQEIAYLSGEVRAVSREIEAEQDINKEIAKIKAGVELLQDRIKKYGMLERLYLEAAESIKEKMLPQIKAYFSWILPKLTNDRYHRVKIDDEFNIRVYSLEREDYVDLAALSGGTVDQLFIALRLAFAKAVSVGDSGRYRQMLFLDEPFSSFDATRRRLFFDLLRTLETNFQQIFIISHLPGLEEHLNAAVQLQSADTRAGAVLQWSGRDE